MVRGRKTMKLLADIIEKERGDSSLDSDAEQTWSALPIELLEQCLSQLSLKDNICVSAVCKRWLAAAVSVRQTNKTPWLMYKPKYGNFFEFYDPSERKKYCLEFPEMRDSKLFCSKDGWLLMMTCTTQKFFFFCPYTREKIELPTPRRLGPQPIAFSSAPTSPSCVLFHLRKNQESIIDISTCRPGDKEWRTFYYHVHPEFNFSIFDKIVFSKGHFYCLNSKSYLGLYNPNDFSFSVHHVPLPETNASSKSWYKRDFMAEHGGDVYLVYSSSHDDPLVFRLDEIKMAWIRIETLGNLSLFVGFFSSQAVTDLLGTMRNSICFSKVIYYGKRCVHYSLDKGRFFPQKKLNDWEENDVFDRIWVEAPKDLSFLCERLADRKENDRGYSCMDSDEEQTWSALLVELLELFLSQLSLKDNIRATVVWKRWLSAAVSVRQTNMPPGLMYMPKYGDFFEFYVPSERKKCCLEFPELRDSKLSVAKMVGC